MKVEYQRTTGKRLTYTITADRWGGYKIHLGDKFLLQSAMTLGAGNSRPTKRNEADAIAMAKFAIEGLRGMSEE